MPSKHRLQLDYGAPSTPPGNFFPHAVISEIGALILPLLMEAISTWLPINLTWPALLAFVMLVAFATGFAWIVWSEYGHQESPPDRVYFTVCIMLGFNLLVLIIWTLAAISLIGGR